MKYRGKKGEKEKIEERKRKKGGKKSKGKREDKRKIKEIGKKRGK